MWNSIPKSFISTGGDRLAIFVAGGRVWQNDRYENFVTATEMLIYEKDQTDTLPQLTWKDGPKLPIVQSTLKLIYEESSDSIMYFYSNGGQQCPTSITRYPGQNLFHIHDFINEQWTFLMIGLNKGGPVVSYAFVDESFCNQISKWQVYTLDYLKI